VVTDLRGSKAGATIASTLVLAAPDHAATVQINVLAPLEIAGQPPAWAGVGASNEASNHLRTGAENGASASFALVFRSEANRLILRSWLGGVE